MTSTWDELLETAAQDKDSLKAELPLAWVMQRFEIVLDENWNAEVCPLCGNDRANFGLWGESLERWGCWACGAKGDVFDLIMRWERIDFREAVRRAAELLREFRAEGGQWTRPEGRERTEPADPEQLAKFCREALARADTGVLQSLIAHKELRRITPEWLKREFFLGTSGFEVVIPHIQVDGDGKRTVTAYKTRRAETRPFGAKGSRYPELYGSWRDRGRSEVVLCEGESDSWQTAAELPECDVMGLPSGAGMEPQDAWVRRLEGRNVVLLFDADVAGRNAALVWFAALDGRASSVKIVQLEDGQDAVTCGDARRAVESALEVPEIVSTVVVDVDGGYVRLGNQPLRLSTWHFQPERLLEQDGIVIGWSGKVAGKRVTITPRDFDGDNFSKWAHSHGLGWQGRKSDGDSILEMLRRGSPFLAKGHATSVVGYHSGHFVMPNRTLGPHGWMHVRGPTGADFEKKVAITPGDVDIGVLKTLTELHAPEVITPVLAWLAAAPLRARLSYFPILAVVGGSGHGKTTLLDACMGAFGWNTHTALTDTTPYAVHALVSGTNAVPVWFDEYRPGARRDSLETLAQVIRGAWDGSEAIKGGLKQNLQELTFIPALAPLVVSGEDTFVETSHRERMVIIDLPLEGRNPDALQGVRSAASEGLGYLYLSWLLEPDTPSGPPNLLALKDRRAVVERVLEWGWMLYTTFAQEMGIRDELPPLTLDLTQSVPKDEPYLTAIEWGLRHFDGAYPLCWEEEGWTYVRTLELTNEILRRGVVMLPGKSRAMMNWLKTNMEGEMARVSNGRAMKIPSDLLTRRLEEINAD